MKKPARYLVCAIACTIIGNVSRLIDYRNEHTFYSAAMFTAAVIFAVLYLYTAPGSKEE